MLSLKPPIFQGCLAGCQSISPGIATSSQIRHNENEENCAVGALGSWGGFLPCPSPLSCQVPLARSLLPVGFDVSLFHATYAGAALIEALNQLAGAVEVNDSCNVKKKEKKGKTGENKDINVKEIV